MLSVIREAAERVGGVPELARKLGVSRQAIYQWVEVPSARTAQIERVTGIPRSRLRQDLFAPSIDPLPGADLYEQDYYAWIVRQAHLLSERRFAELDLANLVEEIEDLGRSQKHELETRLGVLLMHLLKLQYQPGRRSGSSTSSVVEQRARLHKRLRESPSLRAYPGEVLEEEYAVARVRAAAEIGLPIETFPEKCRFRIEKVLDQDFLPGPR
jgi:hypothetical protein